MVCELRLQQQAPWQPESRPWSRPRVLCSSPASLWQAPVLLPLAAGAAAGQPHSAFSCACPERAARPAAAWLRRAHIYYIWSQA